MKKKYEVEVVNVTNGETFRTMDFTSEFSLDEILKYLKQEYPKKNYNLKIILKDIERNKEYEKMAKVA